MSSNHLIHAIVTLNEEDAAKSTVNLLDNDVDPLDILDDCRAAMAIIGQRYEREEAFLPELIMAGEILTTIADLIRPKMLTGTKQDRLGKVVIGTVKGDIHDIAKDIVVLMLDINGFEVFDLGVDVPPETFVDKVRDENVSILALSGFLTLVYDPMKETIEALQEAGLREKVKVMIGGGQIDDYAREYSGADAWGPDAMSAVRLAKNWTREAAEPI